MDWDTGRQDQVVEEASEHCCVRRGWDDIKSPAVQSNKSFTDSAWFLSTKRCSIVLLTIRFNTKYSARLW
jgi:hypothetical protein